MPEAVLVDCLRTAVGKARRGALRYSRPDDLAAAVIRALLHKFPQIARDEIDDVILGCAFPEAEAGLNMARNAALLAGLPDIVPGMTVNRFCSSGLQALALAADRIRAGGAQIIIAGGAESMSLVPMQSPVFKPNPWMVEHRPELYTAMGVTAENVARRYGIARNAADEFALRSHRNAVCAQAEGHFDSEIVPLEITSTTLENGAPVTRTAIFDKDEGPRADTSPEALAALPPAFQKGGTVTAGNSSPASDGAAAALVMSEAKARELGLAPRLRFVSFAAAGVPPGIMGAGPVVAIPKALAVAGLKLDDIEVIELNEAFAAQALAVIRLAGLDIDRVNLDGGAIALGHPLGATGAKLTATLMRRLERTRARYGMVTMCVGGGQGAAGIFERLTA
jgi:acetyl-CoA acyltransferase